MDYKKSNLIKYIIYFIIFSFMGSLMEYLYGFLGGRGIFYDKGIYRLFNVKLFFIPFYGICALILTFFEKFMDRKKIKFVYRGILNAIIIITLELFGGLFTLAVFRERFWDYSSQHFNFLGIISLEMFLNWIFIGYLFSFIYRYILSIKALKNRQQLLKTIFTVFQ